MLPRWSGKLLVLVLLGVAATDFMITMALSAADATAHLIQNPFAPDWLQGQNVLVTLFLFAMLGAVFLRGFKEAIGVAVVLVAIYLGLNLVVLTVSVFEVFTHPVPVDNWWQAISTSHGNPLLAVGFALLVFPKHALGLSGFERGVAVMPQIQGHAGDTEKQPRRPHPGTRKLLTTAALIMSSFLIVSSFTTVVLIPEQEFQPDGQANGRALAFLAHETSVTGSVPSTTSAPSPAPPLWQDCLTSCPATAWLPAGHVPDAGSSANAPQASASSPSC